MVAKERLNELEGLLVEVGLLANRVRARVRSVHGRERLPVGGKSILQALAEGAQTAPQLARAGGSSRQNVQVLVNRLVAGGWVELTDNPAHKSSRLVELTARGRSLLKVMIEREVGMWENLMRGVGEGQVAATTRVIERLRGLLEGRAVVQREAEVKSKVRVRLPKRVVRVEVKEVEAAPVIEAEDEDQLPFNLL